MQEKAAKNLKISMEDIQNNDSPTSLHMTLDHSLIHETSEKYIEDLNNSIDQKTDVIGFAFAVNNEINGCDLYSTNDLFLKMWPKLLKSISIEAISELDEDATKELPSKLQVKDFINNANQANEISNTISGASKTITKESEKYVLFEMQNLNNGNSWIHRNYIVK